MRSMKIAFLHFWTLRMRRGVETIVQSLANEMSKSNVDVSILTARQTQPPLVPLESTVRVKQYPTFRYYEFVSIIPFYTADLIRERYDVVIVFFADFGEGPALRLASRFAQPRMLLYLTFPYESAPHRYQAYKQWGWGKQATCILADARYTAQRAEGFFQRPIRVLPSGTDPERFRPDAAKRAILRRKLSFAEDDIVLLNVAALEERKGVGRVIESLPQIRAQNPNIRYLILGDGPEKPALQKRVSELELSPYVTFAGTTADLSPYYNAADIFVMLPDSEAGSVACLEAMASGLPVVVSDTGGFREVVDDTSGRVIDVDTGNQSGIARAILELGDRGLRQSLGAAGRQRVETAFSWRRIGEQFSQLCRSESHPAS
jgi:phosphatidylinositol alpha-1,6-mannosyltransferase